MSLLALQACGARVSGTVGEACASSSRSAANPALCSCVQGAADRTLSRSDQRRAAEFFSDPQQAQDTRQSDRPSDEAFWLRYRDFLETAETLCSAG